MIKRRNRQNATERQLNYWNSMIGEQGNGFKKGHSGFGTKESYEKVRIKMLGNTNGFKKSMKLSQEEIQQRIKTRQLNGWNKKPEETKRKQSNSLKVFFKKPENLERWSIMNRGERNPMWKDGISFEPYSIKWTKSLRESIRERDYYTCKLCGKKQTNRVHCVHHIDYNKENCHPKNLITLCIGCNSKVNANREYWTNYFNLNYENLLREMSSV